MYVKSISLFLYCLQIEKLLDFDVLCSFVILMIFNESQYSLIVIVNHSWEFLRGIKEL